MAIDISQLIASAKSKVGKVAQKWDRDQSMPGFQFAQGGLGNRLAQTFRPQTGTIATSGRNTYNSFASRPVDMSKPIPGMSIGGIAPITPDMALGGLRGISRGVAGFTNLDKAIGNKLGFDTFSNYQPTTTGGKVAETVGGIAGYGLGVGKILSPAETFIQAGVTKALPRVAPQVAKYASKPIAALLAESGSSVPLAATESFTSDKSFGQSLKENLTGGVAGRLTFGGLPLLAGMTKQAWSKEISSALKNEPGIISLKGRLSNLSSLPAEQYIKESAQLPGLVKSMLQEVAPSIDKALSKIEKKDPELWIKQAIAALEDRVVTAKDPVMSIGLQARAMGKLDTPKLSVEPTVKDNPLRIEARNFGTTDEFIKAKAIPNSQKFGTDIDARTKIQAEIWDSLDDTAKRQAAYRKYVGGKATNWETQRKELQRTVLNLQNETGNLTYIKQNAPELLSPSKPLSVEPTKSIDKVTESASKYGWTTKQKPEGIELISQNGKATILITEKKNGQYKFSWPNGEKLMDGRGQIGKSTENLIEKMFYGKQLEPSKPLSVEPTGGEPLYHGTTSEFDNFDLSKAGTRNKADQGFAGKGIYLSNSKQVAEDFSTGKDIFKTEGGVGKPRIIETKLNPKAKVLEVNDFGELADKLGLPRAESRPSSQGLIDFTSKQSPQIREKAMAMGYDAIKVDGGGLDKYGTPTYEMVVFDPKNIITTNKNILSPSNPLSVEPVGGKLNEKVTGSLYKGKTWGELVSGLDKDILPTYKAPIEVDPMSKQSIGLGDTVTRFGSDNIGELSSFLKRNPDSVVSVVIKDKGRTFRTELPKSVALDYANSKLSPSPLGGKVGGEVTSSPVQELPTQVKPQEATALEVKPPVSQALEQTPKTSQVETKPVVESKPLDNIISNESKQRGFLETVQESPKTRKGTKVKTKALPQEYDVVGNRGEIKKADKIISRDVDEAKRSLLAGEVTGVNETVLGIRLAKHYEKTKQLDSAVDVIEHLDRQLRESGRAIQAASLWNKMSPEAILRSANRVAEKLGKQLDDVTKQTIVKRMGEVSKMPEGEAKQKATVEVLNYIADKLPPSFGDNFEAYRYTNMLSSPKSHERNIYNNLFNTLITRPVDIAIQSIYDIAKHPNNPVARDVSLSDVPRYYKHVFTSFGNAMEAAKEGMKNQPLTADLQGNAAIEQIRRGKVAKPLQIIPKFMQAQDSFFSTLIASGEKARLLKNGLSEEAANKGAREIAESYLLRDKLGKSTDKGYIVRALDSLGKLALEGRKLPVVGKAWSWFVPFVTTPINAAKMMVEHSVLGLPGAKMSSENLAKATVGTMISAYGAMLAAQDKVTWEAPTDQKQKEMYYASGKKPFSILVGDKWVPAWYLGPYALALMMPAAVKQYNDESPTALTDDQITKLGRAVSSISKFIVSQTPLSGVGGFFSMLEGDSDYTMSNLAGGTATQAIPLASMQRYINTIIDPIYRKGSDFEAQIKKSLLGQTEGLQPYLTPTGEESKRLPINSVLPYDIGQRDLKYEPYERARRDKLQQNKQINLAKKQAQEGKPVSAAGGVYFNMDGSTVDVGKVASMPSTTGYDKVKKQEATYKIVDDVLKLPIDQQEEALKKLGVTPYQAQYYTVSNSSVEAKTAFVQDQIESMINQGSTRNDVIGQLIKLREDVNGTQIASDNVLKKLVDQNIISQQDYNNLKQVKLENGQIKRKKVGRAKKVKMPQYNYKALMKPTKVARRGKVKIKRIKI